MNTKSSSVADVIRCERNKEKCAISPEMLLSDMRKEGNNETQQTKAQFHPGLCAPCFQSTPVFQVFASEFQFRHCV